MSRGAFASLVIIGALIAGMAGGAISDLGDSLVGDQPRLSISDKDDGNRQLSDEERNIAGVAEKVAPSVVSITTTTESRSYYGFAREGAGTGVIISQNGYVLTNKHVVDGASVVSVTLENGDQYDDVRVVALDPLNDIAFLKIPDAKDLPVAALGDSSTVQIGQSVVAIGNSLGQYKNTVTSGIISGTNRPIMAQSGSSVETLTDLIQTDAAINPGNSGGPQVNMSGQVIGINTAIAEDAEGIGFAIPINATKGMLSSLLETGEAERSFLGVNYLLITPEVVSEYDLSVDKGALVESDRGRAISRGGPADRAGIKQGDIITKVGDIEVGTGGGVATLIGAYAPGDKVELTIMRDGKERKVTVTLGAYPI